MILHLGAKDQHFWITYSVARVIGLNLPKAITAGKLHRREVDQMVNRCRTCQHVDTCQQWLAHSQAGQQTPLDVCSNANVLNRLRQTQ